jgi:hypothetical protein
MFELGFSSRSALFSCPGFDAETVPEEVRPTSLSCAAAVSPPKAAAARAAEPLSIKVLLDSASSKDFSEFGLDIHPSPYLLQFNHDA